MARQGIRGRATPRCPGDSGARRRGGQPVNRKFRAEIRQVAEQHVTRGVQACRQARPGVARSEILEVERVFYQAYADQAERRLRRANSVPPEKGRHRG
jgi:hypothetical protein